MKTVRISLDAVEEQMLLVVQKRMKTKPDLASVIKLLIRAAYENSA